MQGQAQHDADQRAGSAPARAVLLPGSLLLSPGRRKHECVVNDVATIMEEGFRNRFAKRPGQLASLQVQPTIVIETPHDALEIAERGILT